MITLQEELWQVSIVLTSLFLFISLFLTNFTFNLSTGSAFLGHLEYVKIIPQITFFSEREK